MLAELLAPFLDPASRTHLVPLALGFAVASMVVVRRRGARAIVELIRPLWSQSGQLDAQLLIGNRLLRSLGLAPSLFGAKALAEWVVSGLGQLGRPPDLPSAGVPVAVLFVTAVLFVVADASRFVTHWLLHRVPVLWAFHQVHHSAETLSPLTYHRVHPVEAWLYQLRGALVTGIAGGVLFWAFRGDVEPLTLFGVHALGWICNATTGNLRHSHVWIGFGKWERYVISPAQHQLHHGRGTDGYNLGTWLAIWDRMAGTWAPATRPPRRFGLACPNHGHELLSAWLGPLEDLARRPDTGERLGDHPVN